MAKNQKSVDSSKPQPTPPANPAPPDPKPQSFVTSATEGETITSRVKTTRELYMELIDVEKKN